MNRGSLEPLAAANRLGRHDAAPGVFLVYNTPLLLLPHLHRDMRAVYQEIGLDSEMGFVIEMELLQRHHRHEGGVGDHRRRVHCVLRVRWTVKIIIEDTEVDIDLLSVPPCGSFVRSLCSSSSSSLRSRRSSPTCRIAPRWVCGSWAGAPSTGGAGPLQSPLDGAPRPGGVHSQAAVGGGWTTGQTTPSTYTWAIKCARHEVRNPLINHQVMGPA